MTREALFAIVKANLLEVLPELDPAVVTEDKSMKDLGANSIDRADVIVQTMEQVGIRFTIAELSEVKNLSGLVDFLAARVPDA